MTTLFSSTDPTKSINNKTFVKKTERRQTSLTEQSGDGLSGFTSESI